MDGPRVLKLKSAFEKMLSQLFSEAEIDEQVKEDIHSLFTQLLLKYSIPSKLNELDSLIQRQPNTLYDITDPNAISSVLSSHISESAHELDAFITEESTKIKREISSVKEREREIDQSLAHFTAELTSWMKMSESALGKIKKQTQ
ncbi:hypothetical protein NEMIN01_1416 [Nematocida minor]|uniref:uncharacterized protein n=1 Tax=Nematocida minor TaxID=1912983 RepID=UPI00221F4B09|nr:uncharacterized protein NEMIN01_1416 [Nematocida minor]KAI5191208.1 hypothetical protein NEMIN01_1416 [Nematocida minor]